MVWIAGAAWMMVSAASALWQGDAAEPASPSPTPTPSAADPAAPAPNSPSPTAPSPATNPPKPDAASPTNETSGKPASQTPAGTADSAPDSYVLGFTMQDIDGKDVELSQFKGKVVLIVNVASKCGYTPQYAGLEKLYKAKSEKGLVILGFPANDFGEQEPGSNAEIKSFCSSKYNVTFPMFAKISVRGSEQHPLYKKLASQPKPIGGEGVPGWNFTKFVIDRQGNVVAKFDSKVKPDDPAMVRKIDELLGN